MDPDFNRTWHNRISLFGLGSFGSMLIFHPICLFFGSGLDQPNKA
jgi:hypothetical protein